jgi:hypothetical protein
VEGSARLLAVHHVLLGPVNLLVIGLPDGWALRAGRWQPEVERTVARGDRRWAQVGRGSYALIPGPGQAALDLAVHLGGRRPRPDETVEQGGFAAAGHAGRLALGYRVRPWIGRARWPVLWAALDCPETGRHLELELSGPTGAADTGALRTFARWLPRLACH